MNGRRLRVCLVGVALGCAPTLSADEAEPALAAGDWLAAAAELGLTAAADGLAGFVAELQAVDAGLRGSLAPLLAEWIAESRDAALRAGVEQVPESIRAALAGYVPDAVLDRARWRVGSGVALSLQQTLLRSGYVPAITLEHVIVFDRERDARQDPALWVHELKHVMQYAEWGIDGFARRYLLDYDAIESEASAYRRGWLERELAGASR